MKEEAKRRITQMCEEIVNMLSEGKTVEDINKNDDSASCIGIDCPNCPLYEARKELDLGSCMDLTESQILDICREYLENTSEEIVDNIFLKAKRLTKEEM